MNEIKNELNSGTVENEASISSFFHGYFDLVGKAENKEAYKIKFQKSCNEANKWDAEE